MAPTAYLFHLYMKHCATRAGAVLKDFMEYTSQPRVPYSDLMQKERPPAGQQCNDLNIVNY
jgi:hypothetical protein